MNLTIEEYICYSIIVSWVLRNITSDVYLYIVKNITLGNNTIQFDLSDLFIIFYLLIDLVNCISH